MVKFVLHLQISFRISICLFPKPIGDNEFLPYDEAGRSQYGEESPGYESRSMATDVLHVVT